MYDETNIWDKVRRLAPARIRAARLELKLSQEDFAALVGRQNPAAHGKHPSGYTVSRWELGKSSPGTVWGLTLLRMVEESEARRTAKIRQQLAELETVGASQ